MSGPEKGAWPWYTSGRPTLIGRAAEYFSRAKVKHQEKQAKFTIEEDDESVKVYDRDEELKRKLDWVGGIRKRV